MKALKILQNRVNSNLEITEDQVTAARKELDEYSAIVREEELKLLSKPVEGQMGLEL